MPRLKMLMKKRLTWKAEAEVAEAWTGQGATLLVEEGQWSFHPR
jgi:hypothetical protein